MPGPWGTVEKNGNQPKVLCKKTRAGRIAGSITKIAHNPSTTEGMAANSSTIMPIKSRRRLGSRSSVMKIAVPMPRGTASSKASRDDTSVP